MIRNKCVICQNSSFNDILILPNYPIKNSVCDKINYEHQDLHYIQCTNCKCIQIKYLISPDKLYNNDTNHNKNIIGKTWTEHYIEFTNFIKNDYNINYNVLEIGSSTHKISHHLQFNTWTMIDPGLTDKPHLNNIYHHNCYVENFNDNMKYDIIITSHLIEHLLDPVIVLKKIKNLLTENGIIYFSIPIMDNHFTLFGLHFEHTYLLNIELLKYMLHQCDLQLIDFKYYKSHSIFLKIKHGFQSIVSFNNTNYDSFIDNIEIMKNRINYFNVLYPNEKFYIVGCHTKTQLYIYLGLNQNNIINILDNDPNKKNKYLYGTNLLASNFDVIKNKKCIVFVDIDQYTNEIIEQLKNDYPDVIIY
jgi:hypothetical protein